VASDLLASCAVDDDVVGAFRPKPPKPVGTLDFAAPPNALPNKPVPGVVVGADVAGAAAPDVLPNEPNPVDVVVPNPVDADVAGAVASDVLPNEPNPVDVVVPNPVDADFATPKGVTLNPESSFDVVDSDPVDADFARPNVDVRNPEPVKLPDAAARNGLALGALVVPLLLSVLLAGVTNIPGVLVPDVC
jgi:hypothetical protein